MKLPEIFKNKLEGNINNNVKTFIGSYDKETVNSKEDIFKELPVKVKITTIKGKEITDVVVGKTKNYIITNSRNVIYINDIKDIRKA